MNNFLELHTSSDYINSNRQYYTSTWEYIAAASDYLIPFQIEASTGGFDIYAVDTDGVETDITDHFGNAATNVTSWTPSGTGTWGSSGGEITSGTAGAGAIQISNQFSLTPGNYIFKFDDAQYEDGFQFKLKKAAVTLFTLESSDAGSAYYTIESSASDYTLEILNNTGGVLHVSADNTPVYGSSSIARSGNYYWYDGTQLTDTLSDIFYLKIGSLRSDWIEVCGFADKMKYKLSSTVDYGGVKYVDGFEQWIYKDASVRRSPRSDIEITAEQRNGERIDEKIVSAVRYTCQFKVTEAEYEAFVHSAAGDVEITDSQGKTYSVTGLEMNDPQWYRGNGILEISFNDENNISVWTLNNSDL